MKKVVCYGDSNTWGFNPISKTRTAHDVRWTGVLQQLLGSDVKVEEEGLNGRTTAVDDFTMPGRNGLTYVDVCMDTNSPVDVVVLMLGTNDTKYFLTNSAWAIGQGIDMLLTRIQNPAYGADGVAPKVLVVAPAHIKPGITDTWFYGMFNQDSVRISKELAYEYKLIADLHNCEFLDASEYTEVSDEDCLHLSPEGHEKLAHAIYEKVAEMLK